MIQCYFDDSGSEAQRDHRFVCIAGYIAHSSYWYRFNELWEHLLLFHGIPAVHMKEWLNIAQQKGWGMDKQKAVLREFVYAIKSNRLIGVGAAVDAEVWRNLSASRRKAFGTAQEFCFQRIVRRIIDRMSATGESEPVEIVFDQDYQFARTRLKLMDFIHKGDPRVARSLVSVSFSNSRFYYPLQAADVLAWQTRRQLDHKEKGRVPLESWVEMFTEHPDYKLDYEGEFWDQAMMETNFAAVEKEIADGKRTSANEPPSAAGLPS